MPGVAYGSDSAKAAAAVSALLSRKLLDELFLRAGGGAAVPAEAADACGDFRVEGRQRFVCVCVCLLKGGTPRFYCRI